MDLALPPAVEKMLSSGATSFYKPADEDRQPRTSYFDLLHGGYKVLEDRPGVINMCSPTPSALAAW